MPARPVPPDDQPSDDAGDRPDGGTGRPGADPAGPPRPHGPPSEPTPGELDDLWRGIVANLGTLGSDLPDASRPPDDDPTGRGDAVPLRVVGTPVGPRSWAPDPVAEEAEDHFVPPDPGPVLGGDPLLTMAWSVAVGVPVLIVLAVVLWPDVPRLVLQVGAVAVLGAIGLLLWRMPHRRDDDDPGAVV